MTSFNNQRSLRTDDIAGAKPKTYGSLIRKDYATIENNYIKSPQAYDNNVYQTANPYAYNQQKNNKDALDFLKQKYELNQNKNLQGEPKNPIPNEDFFGDERITPPGSKQGMNQQDYNRNMNAINYAEKNNKDTLEMLKRKMNNQNPSAATKNPESLLEDKEFYENYKKFFGDDVKTPPGSKQGPKNNSNPYQNNVQNPYQKNSNQNYQQNVNSIQKQYADLEDEEFQENIHKFFGIDNNEPVQRTQKPNPNNYVQPISKTPLSQERRAYSLNKRDQGPGPQLPMDEPKFHRKNIFHNDVYSISKTNNYNPVTCQIVGDCNPISQNNMHTYTTNNRDYGKPSTQKYDPKVFEKNMEVNFMNKQEKKQEETAIFSDKLNNDSKFGGKKQYDRPKNEFNLINGQCNEEMGIKDVGKRQYYDRPKTDFNVINGQFNGPFNGNEDILQKEAGKKKFVERTKADFNVISGQRNEENGRYISAKQEYHMERKGEDALKKKINDNNLINQFAGKQYNKLDNNMIRGKKNISNIQF